MSIEAMKLALEEIRQAKLQGRALERNEMLDAASSFILQAIEQASSVSSIQSDKTSDAEKQEPVAWKLESGKAVWFEKTNPSATSALPSDYVVTPLYHAPQPQQAEKQKPDTLRHIEEGHCLLDVDERAWRLIVENRGGCRCYRSPPCFACSEPISEEEMNEVGYTYTTPQPQQAEKQEPVAWYRDEDGIRIYYETKAWDDCIPLYTTLPAAPVQEPVIQRVMARLADLLDEDQFNEIEGIITSAGYTPQPQRQWVGLTDTEIEEFDYYARDLVMDIEKALKEKNNVA